MMSPIELVKFSDIENLLREIDAHNSKESKAGKINDINDPRIAAKSKEYLSVLLQGTTSNNVTTEQRNLVSRFTEQYKVFQERDRVRRLQGQILFRGLTVVAATVFLSFLTGGIAAAFFFVGAVLVTAAVTYSLHENDRLQCRDDMLKLSKKFSTVPTAQVLLTPSNSATPAVSKRSQAVIDAGKDSAQQNNVFAQQRAKLKPVQGQTKQLTPAFNTQSLPALPIAAKVAQYQAAIESTRKTKENNTPRR